MARLYGVDHWTPARLAHVRWTPARLEALATARAAGATLKALGQALGLSRERVRQVLVRYERTRGAGLPFSAAVAYLETHPESVDPSTSG